MKIKIDTDKKEITLLEPAKVEEVFDFLMDFMKKDGWKDYTFVNQEPWPVTPIPIPDWIRPLPWEGPYVDTTDNPKPFKTWNDSSQMKDG